MHFFLQFSIYLVFSIVIQTHTRAHICTIYIYIYIYNITQIITALLVRIFCNGELDGEFDETFDDSSRASVNWAFLFLMIDNIIINKRARKILKYDKTKRVYKFLVPHNQWQHLICHQEENRHYYSFSAVKATRIQNC